MNQALSTDLVQELDLGSARGGRTPSKELEIEVVRELTEGDLPAITSPPPVAANLPTIKNLRHSHHRLAELIVAGRPQTEISLMTGYSPNYISTLQNDPAFAELVAYYSSQQETIFVDVNERLKLLGVDAIEKLHNKLNDDDETWSKRELMEVVTMSVIKPTAPKSNSPGDAEKHSLEITFVGTKPPEGPVYEAAFTEVPSKEVKKDG